MRYLTVLILLLFFTASYFLLPISSQAFDISSTYQVNDSSAKSGDIVADIAGKGIVRTDVSYDNRIFGIIQDDATAIYRKINPDKNDRPIARTGDVSVNITDFNGKIAKGDYITSSPVLGKGMKATQSGYVIGVAISDPVAGPQVDFQGRKLNSGTVDVVLRIEFAELTTARSTARLLENLNTAFFRSIQDPEKFTLTIRYIIAGVIAILASAISFFTFSRSVTKGIEAMGRNPLARKAIQFSIILQVGLTIGVLIAALILSFLIIRL